MGWASCPPSTYNLNAQQLIDCLFFQKTLSMIIEYCRISGNNRANRIRVYTNFRPSRGGIRMFLTREGRRVKSRVGAISDRRNFNYPHSNPSLSPETLSFCPITGNKCSCSFIACKQLLIPETARSYS